jgi:rubrerythrin
MTLNSPQLVDLLKKAYSAEKAASFAYQGHASTVKDKAEKAAIRQIELDEWNHRKEVLAIMDQYGIPVSRWYEFRYHVIYFLGKIKNKKLLPVFEKLFLWGAKNSYNDVDLDKKYPIEESRAYCKK